MIHASTAARRTNRATAPSAAGFRY